MQIDCFVSTLDNTPNRIRWSQQTLEALTEDPALHITVVDAGSSPEHLAWCRQKGFSLVQQPKEGSLHRRFLLAEALAQSEYYLFSDNDVLPRTEYWLARGLDVLRRHPQFGLAVYRMVHCDFGFDHQFNDAEIKSITKGGGLSLIKRGCRTAPFTPPLVFNPSDADDAQYCRAIQKSGFLVGQFEQLYIEHIGRSESTCQQLS